MNCYWWIGYSAAGFICDACFFSSLHQPMNLSTQRSTFRWLSWGTGTSWTRSRSDALYVFCCCWISTCFVIVYVIDKSQWILCVCPQVFGDNMQVKLYAPPQSMIDPSIAVMLLIAIFTVTMGGYWSGTCERWDIAPVIIVHTSSSGC